jgi:hypothetical protein
MICLLDRVDTAEKSRRGKPIPRPKKRKRSIFTPKDGLETAIANRAAINAGWQGTTIAPKKKTVKKSINIGVPRPGSPAPRDILCHVHIEDQDETDKDQDSECYRGHNADNFCKGNLQNRCEHEPQDEHEGNDSCRDNQPE